MGMSILTGLGERVCERVYVIPVMVWKEGRKGGGIWLGCGKLFVVEL